MKMRIALALLVLSGVEGTLLTGCGQDAAAPPPATTVVSASTAPAPAAAPAAAPASASPAPSAPAAPQGRQDDIYPLRLSLLQNRLPPDTVFYFHDPRLDPEGKLGERAHPLRDIYRPAGTYQMRFARKGYRPVDVSVKLTAKGPEPALESLPLVFEATEELAGRYHEAEEALKAGDAKKARAALEKVRELDERYLKTADLLRALAALDERLEQERKTLADAAARLRRGDLESAAKVEALRPKVQEVTAARGRFDQAVARFDLAAAEEVLAQLRETLTPEDPTNRERAGRVDDLKAMRALLDQYEQICKEPRGARERLADLWERDRSARADELARAWSASAATRRSSPSRTSRPRSHGARTSRRSARP
jgi:tetratricopeptide (TPR) repeat protein